MTSAVLSWQEKLFVKVAAKFPGLGVGSHYSQEFSFLIVAVTSLFTCILSDLMALVMYPGSGLSVGNFQESIKP